VFLTSFHPGGTERQMTELIQRLDRDRFDVHVACFHKEGSWLPRVESCAPVTAFPIHGFARPATLARAAAFARWCRARRIRAVLACDLYANAFALPSAALAGVAVRVGSRRELNPDKTPAQIALQRQAYRCAHAVVANSRAAAQQLQKEGLATDRIHVVANGIDAARFAPRTAGRPVTTVLTVANLRKEKAHEVLLGAAARLAPRHPQLKFLIAGDGPRYAELRALAQRLDVEHQVRFLGHTEDVPSLLAQADVFVLPSRSEAFPNGAIEAMAAGLPVIASRVGGLLDLIEDGRTGVLVPPDDSQALAAAIESMVVAPGHAAAIGSAARDEVVQRYSFERMVRAFEDLFLTSLEMPRGVSQAA
jgi:glycosyltransferase involved in cell wall biosynthesis